MSLLIPSEVVVLEGVPTFRSNVPVAAVTAVHKCVCVVLLVFILLFWSLCFWLVACMFLVRVVWIFL